MKKEKLTINDIARLAGVSKTTVSFYLNGKYEKMSVDTKNRIEEAIAKTNFQPSALARSLNFKKTKLIGVIIGDITNSFANQIVKGIETSAKEEGYQLIVGSSDYNIDNEKRHIESMISSGVDGLIIQPTVGFESMYENTYKNIKPIVYFDSPNRNTKGLWVKTNNYESVYDACDYLVKKKYDHYVLITADPHSLTTRLERYRGFVDNMEISKQSFEIIEAGNSTEQETLTERFDEIINSHKSVCFFATTNWLLSKVYVALKKHREIMPSKIGLIGFDSLEWTELATPSITTIVQPAYEEGLIAGKILIDSIEERNVEVPNQILKCRLNECDSTRRIVNE